MSGFSDLVGTGAECGPGNSMGGLMKQFDKDRSLEQDRFGPAQAGSSKQAFRQTFRQNGPVGPPNAMATEFMAQANRTQGPGSFSFADMHRELSAAHAKPGVAPADWSADFARHQAASSAGGAHAEFERAFARAGAGPAPMAPAGPMHMRPMVGGPMAGQSNWAEQFHQPAAAHAAATAAAPAGAAVAAVRPDPMAMAFNEARMYSMMPGPNAMMIPNMVAAQHVQQQQQATISGDKVVTSDKGKQADQQGIAAASGPTWATEFEKRADELMNRESAQKADEQTPRDGKIFSEEFARGLERNWAEEFEQTLDGPLNESAVSGHPQDMDLKLDQPSSEFIHGEADKDWLEQFKDSIQPMLSEQDREWLDTQKEWETLNTLEASYRATDPELNIYRFQHDNYYASLSPAELKDTIQHMKQSPESTSLGDAILALETSVTQTPQDAEMWLLLGLKQQENEQEQAAIAALRKAISLDPNALDAHLALAVSYTNEGYQMDAYDELHEWIARHDRYKSLVPATAPENMAKSETRKNYVQDLYIQAARMSPGQDWDPDVQIALGVLFNISSEYDKAVDCFNAALSKRPDDYILWNRLGATQAHIGNNKEATSAYFRALELQPSFIRARYNLSLASTNMGQHREAAENCLIALSLQQRELQTMGDKGKAAHMDTTGFLPAGGMSTTIWNALQLSMYMLGEPKLAEACERQDLEAFRSKFDF